ncbi:MAG: ankyrin repeat domain-containing protein [Pirellula sp.]
MNQPDELKKDAPLVWSTGNGTDVWTLFLACIEGNLDKVQRLVQADPSLARCHFHYRKPIYFAVRENRLAVAEYLLDLDPDPTGLAVNDSLMDIARDRGYSEMQGLLEAKLHANYGVSAKGERLAQAIRQHDARAVCRFLDESPTLLHVGDSRGNQPIHWAALTRQLDMIDLLLERGADIESKRPDGARPIQLSGGDYHHRGWRDVSSEHPTSPRDVIDHLRERGAYCDLCTASHIGDIATVRELLDLDPKLVNRASDYVTYYPCSGTAIRNAAAAGHLEIVQLLLDRGADPNLPEEGIAPRGHALYSAAANGHFEIAKLLLEHGAYPNVEVESSADTLSRVLSNGDSKMRDLLCSYGASRGVHLLAYHNDLQTAAAVFAANPKLADDVDGLVNAAGENHEDFVRLMLRYQSDLPSRISFPAWSVASKNRAINELLFQHGMNPNARDWLNVTPLHQFARTGDLERAAMFLEHGADVHARDEDICSTPLGWAAKFGQESMVGFLLEKGAKPKLPDDPIWATPIAWALRRGHTQIAEILDRHSGMSDRNSARM